MAADRELLAALALQAIVTAIGPDADKPEAIAAKAVELADALIAELAK